MKRGEGKFQNDEEELGRADKSDTKINLVNKNDNQTEKKTYRHCRILVCD